MSLNNKMYGPNSLEVVRNAFQNTLSLSKCFSKYSLSQMIMKQQWRPILPLSSRVPTFAGIDPFKVGQVMWIVRGAAATG
jgi:hypothetical protein